MARKAASVAALAASFNEDVFPSGKSFPLNGIVMLVDSSYCCRACVRRACDELPAYEPHGRTGDCVPLSGQEARELSHTICKGLPSLCRGGHSLTSFLLGRRCDYRMPKLAPT